MSDNMDLVREYAASRSEQAFETIVSRYINLVYSTALRQVRNPDLAQEVTQAVFIILARKAASLSPKTILSGWLYRTARYASADALKMEMRRQRREQEAQMEAVTSPNESDSLWEQLSPLLDEAMAGLRDKDRDAIVLRYFENKTLGEVGTALGIEERAAQKRVARSLEKLRAFLARRGVALTTAIIAAAVSANSVQAAPVGLAATISATAAKGSVVAATTLTLVKGALKLMAWTKIKTAIAVGTGVLLTAGTITVAVEEIAPHKTPPNNGSEMKIRWMAGKKYTLRVERVETVETMPSDPSQSMKRLVNLTQDFSLSVREGLDNGGRQLQLQFIGETMDVSQGGRKVSSFDSRQNSVQDSIDPQALLLRKMLGTRIQYWTDADGKVEKVEGMEELDRQIREMRRPQDQATFKQIFNEATVKEYVSFAEMMPNRTVAIGDRWRIKRQFVTPVGILASDMEYTLKSREQHGDRKCWHIGIEGSISSKADGTAQTSLHIIKKGRITGDAWFDPELGMVADAAYDQNITMENSNRGQTITLQLGQKIGFILVDVTDLPK